jgi:hypothetical protein
MKHFVKVFSVCLLVVLCSFAAEWITVENKPGKFKVLFPRTPQESEDTVKTAIGTLTMKMFMYEVDKYKDDNAMYGVIYSDYPDSLVSSDFKDEILDNFFNKAIEGAAANIKGDILSKKVISIKGYPGRQARVSFADGKGIMNLRMYLVKNRSYFLEVGYEKEKEGNPAIDKFFNSFTLMP